MKKHLVIPDTQCKPGVPIDHLGWAGEYAAEKQPDVIIHLGDHYDLPSLSSYDELDRPGDYHARSYESDLAAGDAALLLFQRPLRKRSSYSPRKVYLVGNHEQRYQRLIEAQPKLRGAIREPWAYAKTLGWDVIPFLQITRIDGVAYCHYFCRGPNGTVMNSKRGAPSARAMVNREMQSCIAGHKQGLDTHIQPTGHGMMRGVIAGSFYQHEEEYLSPQGTNYWRGILMLHEVQGGNFNMMEVSLQYLKRRYAP